MQRSPLPPARGLAAVNACYHPIQDVTKPHTPAMGHGDAKGNVRRHRRPRSPKTPQVGKPLLVGLPPSVAQPERNAARPPPSRGADVRLHGAKGAGRRHCRPAVNACYHPIRDVTKPHAPAMGHGGAKGSARRHRRPRPLKKRRRRASPYSWACRRLLLPSPQPERNAARPPPTRGADVRLHGAKGAGRRHCRPAVNARFHPIRDVTKHPCPLPWGMGAPTRRRRHCPAALPP